MPYYVTSSSRQGIQTFGVEAATLFSVLKPRYALHVGVCAAISGQNIAVEDVIFGERALNYEEGKWALKDDQVVFKPDVKVAEVKDAAMGGFIAQADQPLYKYGDFVSGCAIHMDASFIFDRVKNTTLRNVAALDMEASAFLQACEFTGVRSLGVIKGVSDMGDGNRGLGPNDKHYKSALLRAARAVKRFVSYRWEDMPPKEAMDRSKQPGAVITRGYFDNFVARVMDKLSKTGYKASTEIKVEGLKVVLPKGNKAVSFDANRGALTHHIQAHGLQDVILPGPPKPTPAHLKGSYLVDLPTTLAGTLENEPGSEAQVELFGKVLAERVEEAYEGFVEVITWEKFTVL
ncbi:hypothetical protein FOQG_18827 [Fusarium oxysporum f. sp. raphani 54005]|uniref:Nucleoside phosphorylase domain-containing protein n=1 Tax=Fusarium oxysporum f. sp. raphani 54005 TaxID=1089458 RepID=X0B2S9_FUSOX|nr:hypothetical protein FOQG_18827 [Fusarium oxysporum f. sp. raphani 54005]